jgi:hypothetical protein
MQRQCDVWEQSQDSHTLQYAREAGASVQPLGNSWEPEPWGGGGGGRAPCGGGAGGGVGGGAGARVRAPPHARRHTTHTTAHACPSRAHHHASAHLDGGCEVTQAQVAQLLAAWQCCAPKADLGVMCVPFSVCGDAPGGCRVCGAVCAALRTRASPDAHAPVGCCHAAAAAARTGAPRAALHSGWRQQARRPRACAAACVYVCVWGGGKGVRTAASRGVEQAWSLWLSSCAGWQQQQHSARVGVVARARARSTRRNRTNHRAPTHTCPCRSEAAPAASGWGIDCACCGADGGVRHCVGVHGIWWLCFGHAPPHTLTPSCCYCRICGCRRRKRMLQQSCHRWCVQCTR